LAGVLKKLIQLRVKYDSGILSPIIISFTASEGKENNSEVSPGLFERIRSRFSCSYFHWTGLAANAFQQISVICWKAVFAAPS
jgi:hypothetical protein